MMVNTDREPGGIQNHPGANPPGMSVMGFLDWVTEVRRSTLTVSGAVLWAVSPGLNKIKKRVEHQHSSYSGS